MVVSPFRIEWFITVWTPQSEFILKITTDIIPLFLAECDSSQGNEFLNGIP